ncbi:uncharacterized protein EV420DRAFT_1750784 [Desarmillaria tabescens]|uniref:Uncharacterized protein n=1 Tax=Armillaria tabescens TaxID=1929756 RepID=A0AA39MX52_ARMTA|nr:uncharacterized protein EV420DRAFT_1750784 [Desarmillaria tabescens]KAK0449090.1 hypothetical protein EV420DRAFT_1750784 [Desarmillaria tabescens]
MPEVTSLETGGWRDGFSDCADSEFQVLAKMMVCYEVITSFTETGRAELTIKVPLQWVYTGQKPVIPSSLADTPCATLGIQGILIQLNTYLGMSHTLNTLCLSSLLEEYIKNNYDFGTAYGHLCMVWKTNNPSTIQDELHKLPWWVVDLKPWQLPNPISHAWMDEKDHINVWTPINGKEWPVPIPKDVDLCSIRIEMLNLGLEQKDGLREDLHVEEWKLDVPTIGRVYAWARVAIYLSGLGKPLRLKEGDLDSDQSWFRHAWTLQESPGIFLVYWQICRTVSTNSVDKVAGLAFPLRPQTIPAYHESGSLEDAWTALVNTMCSDMQAKLLFLYPEVGQGCKKWRPTWEQVMTDPLPKDVGCLGYVEYDDEKDEDWYEGSCIEKGLVQGSGAGSTEGGVQHGELVVEDAKGMLHIFKIIAAHQYLIPEDSYTLLGDTEPPKCWAVGQRLPEARFEKVSVFEITDREEARRLEDLDVLKELFYKSKFTRIHSFMADFWPWNLTFKNDI